MYFGYIYNYDGSQSTHKHPLDENQEVIWRFVAKYRSSPKVVVKDAIDNTLIEVENGKVLWPKLTEPERSALFDNLGITF
jgi:hypothetical protein